MFTKRVTLTEAELEAAYGPVFTETITSLQKRHDALTVALAEAALAAKAASLAPELTLRQRMSAIKISERLSELKIAMRYLVKEGGAAMPPRPPLLTSGPIWSSEMLEAGPVALVDQLALGYEVAAAEMIEVVNGVRRLNETLLASGLRQVALAE